MEKTINLEYLEIKKESNLASIEKARLLISYYCSLYSNILSSINSKKEQIKTYEMILSIKDALNSPDVFEKINLFSDEYLEKIIESIKLEIEDLTKQGIIIKEKINNYQRESYDLEEKNKTIGKMLGGIDDTIDHPAMPKVKERKKNETRRRIWTN